MGLKHQFKSAVPASSNPALVDGPKWNADHYFLDATGAPLGAVGDLASRGAGGVVALIPGGAGVLTQSASGAVPAWSTNVTLDSLTVTTINAGTINATTITLGGVSIDAPELGYLDGVTPGTVLASKAVVVDSNKDIGGFRNITATGTVTAGTVTAGTVTATNVIVGGSSLDAAELGYLDGVVPGTVSASKAVVVDANKDIGGFNNITATGTVTAGTVTATNVIVGGSSLDAAELGYLDGVVPGTVSASKAVVVDANKDITGFRNLTLEANAAGGQLALKVSNLNALASSRAVVQFVTGAAASNIWQWFARGGELFVGMVGAFDAWKFGTAGHLLAATDNTYDIGASGANRPRSVYLSNGLRFGNGTWLLDSGSGFLGLYDAAQTGFSRLMFGGQSSAFPALRRTAAQLDVVLADASDFAGLSASFFSTRPTGASAADVGALRLHNNFTAYARNAANTGNYQLFNLTPTNLVTIGDPNIYVVMNGSLFALGGADGSHPALHWSGSQLRVKLGDNTAYATLAADSYFWGLGTRIAEDAVNVLRQSNGTNTQQFRVGPSGSYIYINKINAGDASIATADATDLGFGTAGVNRWRIAGAAGPTQGHWLAVADNTYDIGAFGTGRPRNLYLAGDATVGLSVTIAGGGLYGWTGKGYLSQPADGVFRFSNAAIDDFGRLCFGGTSISYPALKRSGQALQVRFADDSGFAGFYAGYVAISSTGAAASFIQSIADGVFALTNNASTDFNRLQFGGTTSAFPALKRNGTSLQVKLADDSALASFQVGTLLQGALPALSGSIRLTNGSSNAIIGRNAANTGDVPLLLLDGGNDVYLGDTTANSIVLRAVTTLVRWGGASNAFPALKRTGASLSVRLADDSGYTALIAESLMSTIGLINLNVTGSVFIYRNAGSPEGLQAGSVGAIYLRTDGGPNTTLYVKESGTGNTGWVAK